VSGVPARRSADILRDLQVLLRSRYGLVHLETSEERRALSVLRLLAARVGVPLFHWSRSRGLELDGGDGAVYGTLQLGAAFGHVAATGRPALYHFHAIGAELAADKLLADQLREAVGGLEKIQGAIVVTGEELALPDSLRPLVAWVRFPGPGREEFIDLLSRIIRDVGARQHVEVALAPEDRAALANQLAGLTMLEAEKILTKAIVEDGRLDLDDLRHVVEAKRSAVEREGLLEYYPLEDSIVGVADLHGLRSWLDKRKAVVTEPLRAGEFGLPFPRGVLLLGVPGCGKSLSAKSVAMEWRLPLLKLDTSTLYNKFIGESEKNFRRAMRTAENMAPVVLWIDEIEKAFAAGGDEDGGVSQRILGTFLSWMQERRGDVFVVATANDIDRLPPEFLRKGRFDEIFFVDLPDLETRREIFRIHIEGREQEAGAFDLESLARATDGFSGAEIEQVVISGLYTAFAAGKLLSTAILAAEIRATRPLAVTMAERVARIRHWAAGRAVPAN
jgi:MoxR-like ATPase